MAALKLLRFLENSQNNDECSIGVRSDAEKSNEERQGENNGRETSTNLFADVKKKMIAMQVQLTEKERTNITLREAIRRLKERQARELQGNAEANDEQQAQNKAKFETAMKRQMEFMSSVLKEKEDLSVKAESLVAERDAMRVECERRVEKAADDERIRVRNAKEKWKATEKASRQRWVSETKRTIKQDTIRALEPEVQRLIDQHAKQKIKMAQEQDKALSEQETRMHEKFRAAKKMLCDEADANLCARLDLERKKAQTHLQAVLEEHSRNIEQIHRDSHRERDEERRNVAMERVAERAAFQELVTKMRDDADKNTRLQQKERKREQTDAQEQADALQRNQRCEQKLRKELSGTLALEKKEMKETMTKERDREIALVIEKLGIEQIAAKQKFEDEMKCEQTKFEEKLGEERQIYSEREHKLEKIVEEKNAVIKELKKQHRLKSEFAEKALEEVKNLRVGMSEFEHDKSRLMVEKTKREEQILSLRSQMQTLNINMKNKLEDAENSYDELITKKNIEMTSFQESKDNEISAISLRVRDTLAKKETTIRELKRQLSDKQVELDEMKVCIREEQQHLLKQIAP